MLGDLHVTDSYAPLRKRGKFCGRWSAQGRNATETRYHRVNCKCWECSYCGPKKAGRYKHAIRCAAEKHDLKRFLTLTLDPKTAPENPVKYINRCWAEFRVYMKREFGKSVKFIRVMEFQKNTEMPHFHVLVDRYIPQSWIKETWQKCGGGMHVDIRAVSLNRVSHYLAKYLTKELLMSAPKRSRRVTVSRGITLNEKRQKTHRWRLIKSTISWIHEHLGGGGMDVRFDAEEQLESFVIPGLFHPGRYGLPLGDSVRAFMNWRGDGKTGVLHFA